MKERTKQRCRSRLLPSVPAARAVAFTAVALAFTLAVVLAGTGCGSSARKTHPANLNSPEKPAEKRPEKRPESVEGNAGKGDQLPSREQGKPFVRQFFPNNKTIHFKWSDPPNNALLTEPPETVTVSFNSDLGSGSFIRVTVEGREVSMGSMILHPDNRTVSVRINPYVGTGNYKVEYAAYWSDGSYCEGSFGFSVQVPNNDVWPALEKKLCSFKLSLSER